MPKMISSTSSSQSSGHAVSLGSTKKIVSEGQVDKIAAASALTSLHSWSPQLEDTSEMDVETKDEACVGNDGNVSNKNKEEDEIPLTFPQRLMDILSSDEHSSVITWLPHGKAFIVYKKRKFTSDVLPRYFKQSKYTSFTRKLNRWGFTRVTRGPETGAYFHSLFRRDDKELCSKMCCKSVKSPVPIKATLPVEIALSETPTEAKKTNASYVPPPAFPPDATRALELAKNVHKNTLLVQQLIEKVSLQSKVSLLSKQTPRQSKVSQFTQQQLSCIPQPQQGPSTFYPAMNPNSNLSMSVVQAALTTLNRSINSSNSFQPNTQTQSCIGLSKERNSPPRASAA